MNIQKTITLIFILLLIPYPISKANQSVPFYDRILPHAGDVCIISLGGNCRNSTWMKELNIRFQAFPFDWVESEEIDGIISLVNNKFRDYLSFESLIPHFHSHYNRVRDKQYKINLVHDFSFQGTENFSFAQERDFKNGMACIKNEYISVYAKYKRRIARFMNLAQNYKTLIFIRTLFVDKISAIALHDALVELFGTRSKIILVVVNDTEEFKEDWGYPTLKNFYLPTLYLTHDGYGKYFGQIIEQILA